VRTFIALLRGVNVGGNRMVEMARLREIVGAAGGTDVRTLLQSGNVVFRSSGTAASLERKLEAQAASDLGLQTQFFVRTPEEWTKILAANPFPDWAERDPGHLIVGFLDRSVKGDDVRALREKIRGPELVEGKGRELYLVYPAGMGTSRFTSALIEKTLGSPMTARNWNTVTKLAALAKGL
jgi:uncharacterized protein (DUF1697 family)